MKFNVIIKKYDHEAIIVCILIAVLIFTLGLDYGVGPDTNNTTDLNQQVKEGNTVKNEEVYEEGIPIISETVISPDDAKKWAKTKGATDEFIGLADLYWKYAAERGNVNPALAFVQAAKETGFGKFGGVLDASYRNPCGMKTSSGGGDYDKNAHTRFDTWDDGVKAHLDHLALYSGAEGYPRQDTTDPRHFASIYGVAKTAVSLNGKWSSMSTYGEELVSLYNQMLDSAGKVEVFATK